MFLISIEGGDGSGKGFATRTVSEVLRSEFCFSSVETTAEPRRSHPLGRLAIESVRKNVTSPEQEAGLFAADRLDHSHGWILPRLREGRAVVSERNVHSSIVYQGIVGGLGVERVSHMNSAALIPDLCIWVDCDPEIALKRIRNQTLRGLSNKEEYFETSDFQAQIRDGYHGLLSGKYEIPTPFDMGAIIGPISNEGSQDEFRKKLTEAVRQFLNRRPIPINVEMEQVDQFKIRSMIENSRGQHTLLDLGIEPARNKSDWLEGKAPWKVLNLAQKSHKETLSLLGGSEKMKIQETPRNILNHSMSSVCGTLSLLHSAEISELRSAMGPVRSVSERHTRRIVKFLKESGWISQSKTLIGRESPKSRLIDDYFAFSRLVLAIWPIRKAISRWQSRNPKTHLRFSIGQLVKSGQYEKELLETISRLAIIGCGSEIGPNPKNLNQLVDWWNGK